MSKTQKYTNARLNAIQALYASELNDIPLEKIVFQFLNGEIGSKIIEEDEKGRETFLPLNETDAELFTKIVREVQKRKDDIDNTILASFSPGWDKDRIELLLQSILRAGIGEFFAQPNLDAPIIINEYTDITRSFYDGPEVRLVNAVLDKFAKVIRS